MDKRNEIMIYRDEKLSKYNWFNLGGPAKIFFKPESLSDLKDFLKKNLNEKNVYILGAGSNTLFRDTGFDGIIIKLGKDFSYTKKLNDNKIEVGAATLDKKVSEFANSNSLSGFEFLSCIPGSIGGAIRMNSGCYGYEISDILSSIKILDRNGEEKFEASLKENLDSLEKYSGSHYIHPTVGMHASFTLSDDSLKTIHDAVSALESWGIHIHVSEDMADEHDAADRGYGSVLERLNQFDLINRNSLIIHGLHIKETDVNLIGEHNAMFVHNPSSNANNRVGMTPNLNLDELDSGLGTDGMQANMLREGKEGMLIRSSNLPGGAASSDYMQLLFGNNPEIASKLFGRKIGRILQGYQADLAIYDYSPRTPITESTIFGHVFFGLSELPSDVITRGEFRIKDRHLLMHSEKEIKANAVTQAEKLWSHF